MEMENEGEDEFKPFHEHEEGKQVEQANAEMVEETKQVVEQVELEDNLNIESAKEKLMLLSKTLNQQARAAN